MNCCELFRRKREPDHRFGLGQYWARIGPGCDCRDAKPKQERSSDSAQVCPGLLAPEAGPQEMVELAGRLFRTPFAANTKSWSAQVPIHPKLPHRLYAVPSLNSYHTPCTALCTAPILLLTKPPLLRQSPPSRISSSSFTNTHPLQHPWTCISTTTHPIPTRPLLEPLLRGLPSLQTTFNLISNPPTTSNHRLKSPLHETSLTPTRKTP